MISLLDIPEQCICRISVPSNKLLKTAATISAVESALWYASIKPQLVNVKPVKTDTIRYEEIQVFCLKITQTDNIYDIAREVFSNVKYPCLILMHYKNKFICAACQFSTGKTDYEKNVLKHIVFSHWIYPDDLSHAANIAMAKINCAFQAETFLNEIYTQIVHAIESFSLSGITKAHVDRLLKDMLGKCSPKRRDEILIYCTPYKKHFPTDNSLRTKYDRSKRTENYIYRYDVEDIWYSLRKYDATNKVIAGRRYRDVEDLIFSIDSKLELDNDWM